MQTCYRNSVRRDTATFINIFGSPQVIGSCHFLVIGTVKTNLNESHHEKIDCLIHGLQPCIKHSWDSPSRREIPRRTSPTASTSPSSPRQIRLGPAAVLAITGLAIGAAAYNSRPAEPTYYVAPPRSVEPPMETGYWYYCGSSGQYYPYTRYCPEGWQAVLPPR